jgi:hypothetical protein
MRFDHGIVFALHEFFALLLGSGWLEVVSISISRQCLLRATGFRHRDLIL